MNPTHLLLLALLLPGGAALGQEAPSSETPPASEPTEAPAEEEPAPPKAPPPPRAPPRASREEEQPETLISGKGSSGGFGGPAFIYSQILGREALFLGGKGGWIVDHRFVLGGGGFGLVTHAPAPPGAPGISGELRTEFGYGGLWLEYILLPNMLVHASFGTLIGGGVVSYDRIHEADWEDRTVADDVVFTVEPVLSAELNVIRFLRVSAGVGYRYVGDVNLPGLRQEDLTGFTGTVMLRFGQF